MTVNAKSPLTGAIGDSQAGGFFPAEMKNAGFDGVVFLGKAERPVYLWLNNGQAGLCDASHLWGLGTWETKTHEFVKNWATTRSRWRAVGRRKAGAGSGHYQYAKSGRGAHWPGRSDGIQEPQSHCRTRFAAPHLCGCQGRQTDRRAGRDGIQNQPRHAGVGRAQQPGVVLGQEFAGGLPTRNYQAGTLAHAEEISGERLAETILVNRDTCYTCVVRCRAR